MAFGLGVRRRFTLIEPPSSGLMNRGESRVSLCPAGGHFTPAPQRRPEV